MKPAMTSSATKPSLPCSAGFELIAAARLVTSSNTVAEEDWLVTPRVTRAPLVLVMLNCSQDPSCKLPLREYPRAPQDVDSKKDARLAAREVERADAPP